MLDQFDLERPAQREQHSQGASAVAAQALGERVGAVAQFGGRVEHAPPGRLRGSVDATEDDRDQRPGHADVLRDVCHRRTPVAPLRTPACFCSARELITP